VNLLEELKKLDKSVEYLCLDKQKATICVEKFIATLKGEEKESEESYEGLLLLVDTVCTFNLFMKSFLTKPVDKDNHIKDVSETGKGASKLIEELNVPKEVLDMKWEEVFNEGKDRLYKSLETTKKTKFSK
jgi:hypothetical protein